MQRRIAALLQLPVSYLQQKSEELQVVLYDLGGQFKVHQDASAFNPRLFTALVYLNTAATAAAGTTGGETWFPFSGGDALPVEGVDGSVEEAIRRSLAAYDSANAASPTVGQEELALPGLRVSPVQGKAILFFNLLRNGDVDPLAVHAGLPLRRLAQYDAAGDSVMEKWIANYWVAFDAALLKDA